ncbi:MAG TPA: Gfo/Idh/MocA family oxidoreductase [Polyangiaceae bacterium]|nr:Gfo/Idh/MocA family oxidoreductase [Polyangiaceae bacterium]
MSLRIGIVGLGGAGRAHAHRFRRNPAIGEIVGYDVRDVELPGVERVQSRAELLSRVDAVSICTPDHAHFDDIVAALEAGKHVLVEKPMVASHAEAERLKPYLDAHPSLVFGVHHQMRHAPPFAKARELIESGVLGRLFYLEANYWHDMSKRSVQFDSWRMEHGQSLLFGHACHPLDLLMHLAGGPPTEHSTYLSKNAFREYRADYTSATVMLKFPGNVVAKSHINTYCVYPQVNDLVVLGEKGTYIDGILYKDGEFVQAADFFGKGKSHTEVNITDIKLPPQLISLGFSTYLRTLNTATLAFLRTFSKLSKRLMSHPDFGFRRYPMTVYNHDQACQVMIDNFVDAVRERAPILVGYDDAARVIRLCEETEADGLRRMDPT